VVEQGGGEIRYRARKSRPGIRVLGDLLHHRGDLLLDDRSHEVRGGLEMGPSDEPAILQDDGSLGPGAGEVHDVLFPVPLQQAARKSVLERRIERRPISFMDDLVVFTSMVRSLMGETLTTEAGRRGREFFACPAVLSPGDHPLR